MPVIEIGFFIIENTNYATSVRHNRDSYGNKCNISNLLDSILSSSSH